MKKSCFLIFIFNTLLLRASTLTVGLYSDLSVSSLAVTVQSGNYVLLFDSSKKLKSDASAVYLISIENDSIRVKTLDKNYGKFKRVDFSGDDTASLKIKAVNPYRVAKIFDGDFSFFIQNHQLKIRSKVDLEKYVAGVVEAEAGTKQSLEYYKVQAIICRTYALSNMRRHEAENFNLCDNVHCQAYKGNNRINPEITLAAFQTKNLVLVDKNSELITTAFHSNCGGQTCNSEDVWGMKRSYLRSVRDTFCLKQRNAQWTKVISKESWLNYLNMSCKPCLTDSSGICCDFEQGERKNFFEINSVQLPTKNMRNELKLKSSFFSIQLQNDSLLFKGRGYGHGVGLCQEGAIEMAKRGLKYNYILHYYYKDVDIINLDRLHFFKD